jgi:bifunctional DNA-binding transcriptional regulator/antitoxin component of YhaV-PrlF toxin-antitoxin module
MIVTLDSKRRLTLPASVLAAVAGDSFDVQFDAEENAVIFKKLPSRADWLEVMESCPADMTDIPPRRKELPKRRIP